MLERDPEILIFPVGNYDVITDEDQQQWRRWSHLSAVNQGRFVSVSSALVDRPGPRLIDGLDLLAQAIHPDAYTDESTRKSQ